MHTTPFVLGMIGSLLALAGLHAIMMIALCGTRIPAMVAARMSARASTRPGALDKLPAWARNVADNYNNLAEAPTAFYAVVIAIILLGRPDDTYLILAWTYVGLRYAHSLIQATVNAVWWRFAVFCLSWLTLIAMIIQAAISVTGR